MATVSQVRLAQNLTTGASQPTFWPGGRGSVLIEGTFGGANAQVQYQSSQTLNWVDVTNALSPSMNAPGLFQQELPPGNIRINLTGGTGANIDAWLIGVTW